MAFLDETGLAELWSLTKKRADPVIGEYTGSGSSKTVSTGGRGHALMIWSVQYLVFVTPRGGICLKVDNNSITEVTFGVANFINGVLTLGNGDAKVNASGTVYAYQVL